MSVVLAGGGTAGHIEPALALADALRRVDPRIDITCLGTERGLETRLVPLRGYELALIPAVPLPRSMTTQLLHVPGRLATAVSAAAEVLDRTRCRVLVGFGGYVATPAYPAARRQHVPIVIHEANARPGLANRLGARFTRHVFTGSPRTHLPNATCIGIPLRHEIASLDRLAGADKAHAPFALRPDLATRPFRPPARPAGSPGDRGIPGCPIAELRGAGRGGMDPGGRRAGAAHPGPAQRPGCPDAGRGGALHHASLRGQDGSRLWRRRLRDLQERGDDLRRAHRRGAARRVRAAPARQRRAAAERRADRGGRGRPDRV